MSADQKQQSGWRWYDDPYWIEDAIIFLGFVAISVLAGFLVYVCGIGLGWW